GMIMKKITVKTDQAPAAIGPYEQAVIYGDVVYCSGQIGLVPDTGDMISGLVEQQAEQVIENLSAVLQASGSSLDKVIKCTVYLTDMDDFSVVNEMYARYFENFPPAREAVAVSALPKGALIEISCMAHL
ncbi:RidA family protein, partial [Balneolaceae bacterium ANBcel3]|nr:RidA family protein [Balneolaceae bacterium ANBcel3]